MKFYFNILIIFFITTFFGQENKTGKPNVVFIISDQHKLETIGAYGSKIAITPNIDRLAKTGVISNPILIK